MRKFAVSNVMLLVVAFLLTAAMASPAQTLTIAAQLLRTGGRGSDCASGAGA